MQKPKFQNGNFYHICNRGVDKRDIFMDKSDYIRFLISLRYFNNEKPIGSLYHNAKKGRCPTPPAKAGGVGHLPGTLVDILCYCLCKNHFHLLVRQKENNGISEFMKRLSGGYTNYFNAKYERSGALFQGRYKAFELISDGKLWETSFYVNGNAEIHGIEKCDKWPWSSCLEYLNYRKGNLCNKSIILSEFNDLNEYRESLFEHIREKRERKEEIGKFE